ncbi:MAG TPA: extracellular solute-binding protein, partial [Nocardiopsis listeri]|uniref:ABC transporter substrate-binding protein n=1 Tax=Nocardiopsis listeri TaxID=53440 RepID=UPI001D6BD146
MSRTHRISVIGSTALALTLVATACGSSGPGMSEDALQVWALEEAAVNDVLQAGMDSYNEGAEIESELVTFVNDAYKQRLQVALGSPNAPDVFFNWGGGNLGEYVDQGQVFNMTTALDENPEFRDSFLPSVLDVARIEDGYYGVPMLGMQPVVLFTNDAVLEESGLEAPRTYDELLEAIEVLKEDEVTPIVLPGAQGWTQLMWLSYLVERIGGPDVFQAVVDGEEGAWEHPAMIEAMEK